MIHDVVAAATRATQVAKVLFAVKMLLGPANGGHCTSVELKDDMGPTCI